MAVIGIDSFAKYFEGYEDCYAVDRFLEEIVKEDIIFVNLGINSNMQTEVAALSETYVRV